MKSRFFRFAGQIDCLNQRHASNYDWQPQWAVSYLWSVKAIGNVLFHFNWMFPKMSLLNIWIVISYGCRVRDTVKYWFLFASCHSHYLSPLTGSLPYEFKVVIAGNHELTFDKDFMAELVKQDYYRFPSVSKLRTEDFDDVQSLLTNCVYLQDSEVTIKGFRIYGTPW